MKNYLREQSARTVLGNSVEIYRHHLGLLFLIHVIPTFPFNIWSSYLEHTGGATFNHAWLISLVVELVPTMATAVAVSDICLGNRPDVWRSYRRAFSRNIPGMVLTYLLFMAGLATSLLLFVVPGLVFYAWFMFCLVVVVLEGRTGRAAFARSRWLGRGFYFRNVGVIAILLVVAMLMVVTILVVVELAGLAYPPLVAPWPASIATALATSVAAPLVYVGGILLYYDMRVRNEAFDNTVLTEELMR